ncbi:cell division protease ftsH [Microdochium trichocladiopsis]|uniref:Cell division protease ftsH n=1 Tax=Microdochium trichocladiopsis TaxID=1682393 RepID=A0A9P8YF63_9PEZI|nr:cell division protease ftsH [Microdochium trichocladiopsis]KAH7040652.1 cell division protease ftsH [Microdochium trichocladiopsis]
MACRTPALTGIVNTLTLPARSIAASGRTAAFDIRTAFSRAHRSQLLSAAPAAHNLTFGNLSLARSFSSSSTLRPFQASHFHSQLRQWRAFNTGGTSRNLLAHMEEAANRNPNSATAQNAFYQALLRANMPAIIVERYASGRFATNAAATDAYHKALIMVSPKDGVDSNAINDAAANIPGNYSPTQIQAVTQALAARSRGTTLAVSKNNTGTGTKDGPLHVVVDETIGGTIFRWVKFLLWFGLFTYLSLIVLTMLIEAMSVIKRPGGPGASKSDTEVKAEQQKARFTDVHGADEAKEELQEMVEFLRNPERFSQLGGKLPKGILLVGPPGTGKTLLARAVAGEAGVPFFYMSGSEFDEVYVGVGAKRVRDLFAAAKAKSPAIVFIDELDAIGSRRQSRDASYVRQTLNQLLTELDGFDQNSNVIIIGATNFPESLDKALTRPGRFDRHVRVELPDVRGRLAILKHHTRKIKAATDVDLTAIAQTTSGLSGAELENIVNQAAVHASKAKATSVSKADFDWAKDKVIMGAERKTMVITPEEKEMTAYHEAGHALVNLLTKGGANTLYKVTVLPRGPSLGHTAYLPEMDKYSYTVQNYLAMIDMSLGGKLAEEIVYGTSKVTGGASSDLKSATSTAFTMIARLGMSPRLGNMEYATRYDTLSSETRAIIEAEVQRTVDEAYERARKLLTDHRNELDLLAKALVEYETLSREEVEKVIRGEKLEGRIAAPRGPMTVPLPAKLPAPGDFPAPPTPPSDTGSEPPTAPPPAPPPATRTLRGDDE